MSSNFRSPGSASARRSPIFDRSDRTNSSPLCLNRRPKTFAVGLLVCALLSGCPTPRSNTRPPLSPGPPEVRVPPGCLSNLSGDYVHGGNAGYRYLAADDGTTLSISVDKAAGDVGRSATDGGTPIQIRLSRTAKGFLGHTHATGTLSSGQTCPADFLTEIVSCDHDEIGLRSVGEIFLDEACRSPQGGTPSSMREQRLVRMSPAGPRGSPDAG